MRRIAFNQVFRVWVGLMLAWAATSAWATSDITDRDLQALRNVRAVVMLTPEIDDVAFEAEGVADGGGQILFRPADVTWREDGQGIAAKIVRVIDRPDSRRVLAMTESGQPVEFDTAPEFPHRKGEAGFLQIRRPRVYAAA